jgi:probable F420-dependent oxidoreductase
MQVGVALPNFSKLGTRGDVIEVARAAEALGYDSLWTTDHVMMTKGQEESYGHILEAMTTLAYVAALTEKIRLGISVIVFPQRNPVLFAKETATLDVLSGGRLIVGVGAGWNRREFEYLGVNFDDRGKRYDEYLRALRELWTSPEPTFEGRYVSFRDVLFSPRPLQAGGPPIVIGGGSRAALRRAATLADGWHASGASPAEFAAGMRRIAAQANGRQVEGQIRLRTAIGRKLSLVPNSSGAIRQPLDGSADEVIARIKEYQAGGLSHLMVQFPRDNLADYLADMRQFIEEIRPAVV